MAPGVGKMEKIDKDRLMVVEERFPYLNIERNGGH